MHQSEAKRSEMQCKRSLSTCSGILISYVPLTANTTMCGRFSFCNIINTRLSSYKDRLRIAVFSSLPFNLLI